MSFCLDLISICLGLSLIYIGFSVVCKLLPICYWVLCGLISICFGVLCKLLYICFWVIHKPISICFGVICELISICFWVLCILITICLGVLSIQLINKIFRRNAGNDDAWDVKNSDYSLILSVAKRIEEVYGGKTHVGLRIPDPDTGSQQSIDMVLVTTGEAIVFSVKNFSGFVSINEDSSWSCTGEDPQAAILHPDPVAEVKQLASILESYLDRRGVAVREGSLSYKVILPNPNLRIASNLPQVITCDQLGQLKPEEHQLNYIISTAPMRDRLELEGNRFVWGEYLEFKGEIADTSGLKYTIERSKVSRLTVKKLTPLILQLSYSPRDYRIEGASAEWKNVRVKSSSVVLFRPEDSSKVHKFKLSSIFSVSLSA